MKAVVLNKFGGVEGFALDTKYPLGTLKDGFVRVNVKASGFNPVDYKIRQGFFGGVTPLILGADFSGVVTEVPKGSNKFKAGDEVYGFGMISSISNGTYAEYIDISENWIGIKPKSISFEEAASLPIIGLTALEIFERAAIKSHDSVLIVGASGGVGSIVTQLVKHAGATIICTAGSEKSIQAIHKAHGIPTSHIINYSGLSTDKIRDKVIEANGNKPVSVAIDLFGGEIKTVCVESLGYQGRFLTIVEENDPNTKVVAFYPSQNQRSLFGISGTYHLVFVGSPAFLPPETWHVIHEQTNKFSKLLEEGKVKVPNYEVVGNLSVETVQKAHQLLEGHHAHTKLVMKV